MQLNDKRAMEIARMVKQQLQMVRPNNKATLKDLAVVVKAKYAGDYTEVRQTKLYTKHGGDYCVCLEILERININC